MSEKKQFVFSIDEQVYSCKNRELKHMIISKAGGRDRVYMKLRCSLRLLNSGRSESGFLLSAISNKAYQPVN